MVSCTLLLFAAMTATATVTAGHIGPLAFGGATTQYHSQDEWGQYAYGYSGGPSAKHEQRTADGVTRGGYSYVDANGLVQSVSYVSDPVNGFRAAGTNLPVDETAAAAPVPVYYEAAPAPPVHYEAAPAPPVYYGAAPAPPVYYGSAPPAVHHQAVPAAEPVVVVEAARHAPVSAVPVPVVVKTALTPAGTASLSPLSPPHPILLAGRKKRSIDASVVHHPPAVATSYTSVVRHDPPAVKHYAPVVYAAAAPAPVHVVYSAPEPAHVVYAAAPAPAHVVYAAPPAPAPAPVVYAAAPAPAPAPAHVVYSAAPAPAPVPSQYHAQDEHGQYTYGYADGESAKAETRYADGTTKGSYSYVDDHGAVQAVHYTAGADGFRAAGTNIPVHHV